jgi:class 3 adenylate cyclase
MSWLKRDRNPHRIRRQVAGTMVITAFVAVALFGAVNYYAAYDLLRSGTQDQLSAVAQGRAATIESGTNRLLAEVSANASDLGVVRALEDFIDAYDELHDEPLTAAQLAELDERYEANIIEPVNKSGVTDALGRSAIEIDDIRPESDAGRYVQYYYGSGSGEDPPADAGDGSTYSEVNAANTEFMKTLASSTGGGDILLISAETGDVVYSFNKGIDVGTSLIDGPYNESALAEAVFDRLPRVQAGDSVLTDFQIYIPSGGIPVLFASSAIKSGTDIIGALAMQIPVEALNTITTGNGDWESIGLGSGESYVVDSGLVLQSESRKWIEDPQGYLDRVSDDQTRSLIEIFESPVGIQVVDTEPVRTAFEGQDFEGSTKNYLGEKTFSSSTSINVAGVRWAVVTDAPLSDTQQPLRDYAIKMLLVLLVVLPLSGLVGVWLARLLTRPIPPAVEAADKVAHGDRHPELPALGNDEFGDLGRRLVKMAGELERQESALAEEYENKRQLMLAVLPASLVEADGQVSGTGATVDTATVIAVSVDAHQDSMDADDEELVESLATLSRYAEDVAAEHNIERIRVAADRFLFLAGSEEETDGANEALEFTSRVTGKIVEFRKANDLAVTIHIGLSTGAVATGVLERGSLTFGAWGEPVRRALAISALSRSEEILVDTSTAAAAADSWTMELADHIVDLNDEPMTLFTLELEPATSEV